MATFRDKKFFQNLDQFIYPGVGPYDIPEIFPEKWVPCTFVGIREAPAIRDHTGKGVHFYVDDYRFEAIWHNWKRYGAMLSKFDAVMSPDFSMYTDWPKAVQIFNHYRKHFIGRYLQEQGVRVYPTICWSDESSYDWCFDGEPVNSCVSVSSVGTQHNPVSRKLFLKGYDAMLERLKPETIVFYGDVPKECRGNIVNIRPFQDKFKVVRTDGT